MHKCAEKHHLLFELVHNNMGIELTLLATAGWTTGWRGSRIDHPETGQPMVIWPNAKKKKKMEQDFLVKEFEWKSAERICPYAMGIRVELR